MLDSGYAGAEGKNYLILTRLMLNFALGDNDAEYSRANTKSPAQHN